MDFIKNNFRDLKLFPFLVIIHVGNNTSHMSRDASNEKNVRVTTFLKGTDLHTSWGDHRIFLFFRFLILIFSKPRVKLVFCALQLVFEDLLVLELVLESQMERGKGERKRRKEEEKERSALTDDAVAMIMRS